MRHLFKFAVRVGVLGLLPTVVHHFPGATQSRLAMTVQQLADRARNLVSPPDGNPADVDPLPSPTEPSSNLSSIKVWIPATQGSANYGWVQLPHGTAVDLLKTQGDTLWVRWLENVVQVNRSAAADGAIVLKNAKG